MLKGHLFKQIGGVVIILLVLVFYLLPLFKTKDVDDEDIKFLVDTSSSISQLQYDNPVLIELIRKTFIEPPSNNSYNLNHPERLDNSAGQTPFIDNRLNFMVSEVLFYFRLNISFLKCITL